MMIGGSSFPAVRLCGVFAWTTDVFAVAGPPTLHSLLSALTIRQCIWSKRQASDVLLL